MSSALRNFAFITIASLTCVFLAWVYFRNRALTTTIKTPIQHAFLADLGQTGEPDPQKPWLIAHRGGWKEASANTISALESAARLSPKLILWLDVGPSVFGPGAIPVALSEEPPRASLVEILRRFPDRKFVLNIEKNQPGFMESFIADVEAANAADRILVQSPEDGFLKELRERRPLWLFGTSRAQITQTKMLGSMGLAAMAAIKGDVVVVEGDDKRGHSPYLSDAIIEEAHRRRLQVIAGPARTRDEVEALANRGVDGILLAAPSTIVEK